MPTLNGREQLGNLYYTRQMKEVIYYWFAFANSWWLQTHYIDKKHQGEKLAIPQMECITIRSIIFQYHWNTNPALNQVKERTDVWSDHDLVLITLKAKLKVKKTNGTQNKNLMWKNLVDSIKDQYQKGNLADLHHCFYWKMKNNETNSPLIQTD